MISTATTLTVYLQARNAGVIKKPMGWASEPLLLPDQLGHQVLFKRKFMKRRTLKRFHALHLKKQCPSDLPH